MENYLITKNLISLILSKAFKHVVIEIYFALQFTVTELHDIEAMERIALENVSHI